MKQEDYRTSFECLEKQECHPWITVILQFQAVLIGTAIRFYPIFDALIPYITPKSAMTGLSMVLSTASENVRVRLKSTTQRPDIMSYIFSHNKDIPTTGLSEGEMEANSMALVIAGSETLTVTLSGTVNNLLRAPNALGNLILEIRSSFKSESEISGQTTRSLVYLNAVLQEGLRLCSPLPDNLRRAVPKGGGKSILQVLCIFKARENLSHPVERSCHFQILGLSSC
jgi:hypothetical protein